MTVEEYKNLITSQYQNSTKFMAWIEVNLDYLDKIIELMNSTEISPIGSPAFIDFINAFDIDYAVGIQLDILGIIIGQNRIIDFEPTGYSPASNILEDEDYRILLKAKIIKNHWKGSIQGLYSVWSILIPGSQIVIIDNQDMSMTVGIYGNFSLTVRDLITHGYIVPKPEAVQINYFFGTLPVFGYGIQNSFVAGYNFGNWPNYTLSGSP